MSDTMRAFQANLEKLNGATLRSALPPWIALSDVPPLPLTRAADMPARAGFARGALGIELSGLRLTLGDGAPAEPERSLDGEGRYLVTLHLEGIALEGRQTLQGTQIWETGLDGAGTGLPWNAKRRGGGDQDAHPTWIQTANEQRAALQNVPGGNGATLLSTYSNHRAAFNDVLTTRQGYSFQSNWQSPAISAMAEDTNTAVNNNTVVNDPSKIYGTTTYNGNAQTQQLGLLTVLTQMAAHANPGNPDDDSNPYNQAAAATLTFTGSILSNTSASKITDVPQHTKAQVYTLVQTGTPAKQVSAREVHAFLSGSPLGGRDGNGKAWTMCLDEDERAFVRKMQAEFIDHAARLAAQKPVALVQGGLAATLSCYVYLQFGEGEDGTPRLLDGRVELDGFDLEFDDSGWDSALGAELAQGTRDALGAARFVKSLLHDRIADAIERALVHPIARTVLSGGL